MDQNLYKRVVDACKKISRDNCSEIFIYPYGYKAHSIYGLLSELLEINCVDEKWSRDNENILTYQDMVDRVAVMGV